VSQLVSEPYEYNTTPTTIFLKTDDEDTLQCLHKEYSSLDRWEANRDLLSVTTHLQQGKKVSILPPGDMNPEPIALRQSLLEAVPIMR
jgi:hypothetical protein